MMIGYEKYTNTAQNVKALSGMKTSVLTIYKDKILAVDARDHIIDDKIMSQTWLFDMAAASRVGPLAAAGKKDASLEMEDKSRSGLYKTILLEGEKQAKKLEGTGLSSRSLYGKHNPLAAAGNLIETAYDVVRKINDLKKVAGKSYFPERFQGRSVVDVESTGDLNFRGFVHNELLEGQPDIGDNDIPDAVKINLTSFEKSLLADSFRWDIGNREKIDSAISLVERFARQIPGIMEKMVNDKIVAKINAISSALDVPDWDVYTNDHFTNDAAEHIEDSLNLIEDYDGPKVMIAPRKVVRLYKRNAQGLNLSNVENAQDKNKRTGQLPFNEEVTYFIDNAITANTWAVIAKDHYASLWEGPKLNITARNELTSNNNEINILFNFNAVEEKIVGALDKNNGAT